MFSQILLCFLATLAATSGYATSAWKSNTEYHYELEGRTLTGLHEVVDQYSGVLMSAAIRFQRRSEGIIVGKITKAQYAQVHTRFPDGWDTYIPSSKLNYQSLPLTQKPFEVKYKNGAVQELIVEKGISNWEANVIKSIVSQIQVDVNGENVIKSRYNRLPEQKSNDGMFKTMEDSVTGKCETLYDINELPEYILQSKPELVPQPHLKGDGDIIEVVKTRNYSNCEERIVYHYGLHEMQGMEPASSNMGDLFLKSSISRIVLSGKLEHFTIQSSVTTNKIILKPTPTSNHNGMVVSQMNMTLVDVRTSTEEPHQLSQPKQLGNLVYKYNNPFAASNEAREGSRNDQERVQNFHGSSSEEQTYDVERENYRNSRRHQRSIDDETQYSHSESDSSTSQEEGQNWKQDEPTLTSPPQTPMLPEFVGYLGRALKYSPQLNVVEAVQKLTRQIADQLNKPSRIPEEDTLATFTILSKLLRTMNVKEIQEAGRQIYELKNKEVRPYTDAWKVYRDAVAQTGTGPALYVIQEWIINKKIQEQEAATVMATLAYSTRQPTEEYMRTFYVLATKPEVQKQAYLNDTAILSFTELVRRVYISEEESHNQYPVHVFGKFYKKNMEVVRKEYLPYLAQQLERAIQNADSHKIHVYIRALGNVAHREILGIFEPYLEGKKEVSQFQRLFMVVCLDQLAVYQPTVARVVLYKIYQNQGEDTSIRVAAVYQLMKTQPPASMLQRMAEMTNEDSDENVNAAVKSVIESVARLQDPIYDELSTNAQAAVPLLNPKTYGIQYSHKYLRDYVVREMDLVYKQNVAYLGSEDSIMPKGIMYSLRDNMGGARRQYISFDSIVSSVEDLHTSLQQQIEDYEPRHYESAKQDSKWASEYIAKLLNMEQDQAEPLEGNLQLSYGQVKRFFSFNNYSVEQLPHYIEEWSADLRKGMDFNYTKFLNPYETTLSFPTVMGLPFVYTLETPTVVSVNGHIRVKTQPELTSKQQIRIPETLNLTSKIEVVIATKTQAKIGFVTPFDHQHYIAGYDKNIQVYLPVQQDMDIDFKNNNVRIEFEPLETEDTEQIFHYSTVPYTARKDILQLKPVSQLPTYQIVQERELKQTENVYGEKTGMVFHVKQAGENRHMDCQWLYQHYQRHEGLTSLLTPLTEDYVTYYNLSVEYDDKLSTADSLIVQLGWNQTYTSGKHSQQETSFDEIFSQKTFQYDQDERQEHFLKKAAAGINSVDASVYDVSVQFTGPKYTSYNATLAIGKSTVDQKSRVLFYYNKESHGRKYEVCLSAKNQIPNTNSLDYVYALKFDPTSTSDISLRYGEKCLSGSKINLKAKAYQSEERQRFLQQTPMSKVCMQEMQEGNKQLEGCRNMTTRANLLDRYNLDISYENVSPYVRNVTYKLHNAARYMGYYYLDENVFEGHGKPHEIKMQVRFEPNFRTLNVSWNTHETKTQYNNIRVAPWARPLIPTHPVFAAPTRLSGIAQQTYYRPTCVVDQTSTNTFDNTTYPTQFGKAWHVVMHYRVNYNHQTKEERRHQESRFQSESDYDYVILVRDSENNKKEFKIVLNNEKNYWEIDMVPTSSDSRHAGQVLVNQKPVQFDGEHSYDIEEDIVQIYTLPNGEIKVEVNDDFYAIYDGERAKFTATSDEFRGDVRGLCGTFDGQEDTDFLTPKNCILEDPHEFAATYAIIDESAHGPAKGLQQKAQKSPCYQKEILYSNVINHYDVYGTADQHDQKETTSSCSKLQTQYIEDEQSSEICFTVRPIPSCRYPCKATQKIVKNVSVHCVQKSNSSQLWKKQIENGASPDFSLKPVTKQIKIKVAERCSA